MITYLTRLSFLDTADDLADQQLIQQHDEARNVFNSMVYDEPLEGLPANHPLRKMWEGYEVALAAYTVCMALELTKRGYIAGLATNRVAGPVREMRRDYGVEFEVPPWFEDTDVMRSHRSNLIRRYPAAYGAAWKGTPANMPYIWPIVTEDGYDLLLSKGDKALLASGERELPAPIKRKIKNL